MEKYKNNLQICDKNIQEYIENFTRRSRIPDLNKKYPTGAPLDFPSAGYLPIINWQGQDWVMLFFRDIPPIGWNVANGASDTSAEWGDLAKIVTREFSEETVIINGDPQSNICTLDQSGYLQSDHVLTRYRIGEFGRPQPVPIVPGSWQVAAHQELRRTEDYLTIKDGDEEIEVQPVETDFIARINGTNGALKTLKDCIYSINPMEFGFEVIYICKFNLPYNAYILDGEVNDSGEKLIRRPVGLFSLDWLKNIFEHKKLGRQSTKTGFEGDRSIIGTIPCKNFHKLPMGYQRNGFRFRI